MRCRTAIRRQQSLAECQWKHKERQRLSLSLSLSASCRSTTRKGSRLSQNARGSARKGVSLPLITCEGAEWVAMKPFPIARSPAHQPHVNRFVIVLSPVSASLHFPARISSLLSLHSPISSSQGTALPPAWASVLHMGSGDGRAQTVSHLMRTNRRVPCEVRGGDTVFPCASTGILRRTAAFACGAAAGWREG